ncbi:MAG: ABC transporter permease [Duncaniella sp.]|nr:ABC transporter permease [Duncaniella sp.]
MANNIGIIIEREYLERVKKKSFIITTLLLPVVMILFSMMPALIIMFAGTEKTTVLVFDETPEAIGNKLTDMSDLENPISDDITFIAADGITRDSAMRRDDVSGILIIPANAAQVKNPTVKYYSNGPIGMTTETTIRGALARAIRTERLLAHDIPGLEEIVKDAQVDVYLSGSRLDKEEEGEATSSMVSYLLGLGLSFMLYMFVILYGQMVMNSIIEEKNNRVLEVVVSSIKPAQLMMGKILGVGLVALTQILIWGIVIILISTYILPAVIPADIMADAQTVAAGGQATSDVDPDFLNMVGSLTSFVSLGNIISTILIVAAYLLFGFLMYASMFAAIGSSVDNIQDASNLSTWAVAPIGIGILFALYAATTPMSELAFWTSLFPLTSPMVMVARIPYGIPSWEIWLSLLLLVAGFFFMVWVAGKIYRVGIFMYGKKPTVKDLIKWMKYK